MSDAVREWGLVVEGLVGTDAVIDDEPIGQEAVHVFEIGMPAAFIEPLLLDGLVEPLAFRVILRRSGFGVVTLDLRRLTGLGEVFLELAAIIGQDSRDRLPHKGLELVEEGLGFSRTVTRCHPGITELAGMFDGRQDVADLPEEVEDNRIELEEPGGCLADGIADPFLLGAILLAFPLFPWSAELELVDRLLELPGADWCSVLGLVERFEFHIVPEAFGLVPQGNHPTKDE